MTTFLTIASIFLIISCIAVYRTANYNSFCFHNWVTKLQEKKMDELVYYRKIMKCSKCNTVIKKQAQTPLLFDEYIEKDDGWKNLNIEEEE